MPVTYAHPTTSVMFFYVLGKLQEAHAAAIDRHLRGCKRCRHSHKSIENDVADLALALPPVPVPHWLRESLVHSAREVHRLSDSLPALRFALGCSMEGAKEVLSKVDVPSHWRMHRGAYILGVRDEGHQGAELVRLSLDARYALPKGRAPAHKVHVLQGHARSSEGPLRAGRHVTARPGCQFGAYPGCDVLLLITWTKPRDFQAPVQQPLKARAGSASPQPPPRPRRRSPESYA